MTLIFAFLLLLIIAVLFVLLVIFSRNKLLPEKIIIVDINNGERKLEIATGSNLLKGLAGQGIYLPSACSGIGTCNQCKCQILEGENEIITTDLQSLSQKEIDENWKLSCQIKVLGNLKIRVDDEIMRVKEWEAIVISNYNVAPFIKELVIELPQEMEYVPGGFVQMKIPSCDIKFDEFDLTAHPFDHPQNPDMYLKDWIKSRLFDLSMTNEEEIVRDYSLASYPGEGKKLILNVKIIPPPWDRGKNAWMDVNPGIASSYIFNLKVGDKVDISGPYKDFLINDSQKEMLYIASGAGMGPVRSHLFELFKTLKTKRKVTFWYGARNSSELFYLNYFKQLEKEFNNFRFYVVLSEPLESDHWEIMNEIEDAGDGFVGFVHQIVMDVYLSRHPSPEDIEYYFCGSPAMNKSILQMCNKWGIPDENINFEDFSSQSVTANFYS